MALTKQAVVDSALRIGDEEGLAAVTIRRLAHELGVTPMALYWHFKNKDQLFIGMIDALMADVCVDRDTEPWLEGLRRQVVALLGSLRAHPYANELLQTPDKLGAAGFAHAMETALTFLTRGGFSLIEANQVASYLLKGVCALVSDQPCPRTWKHGDADEWRRQIKMQLHRYPAGEFPKLNAFADSVETDLDLDEYYAFGVDLLLAGVETMSSRGA
ncbi:TetR/AcrR family transcriptional regulator [Actinocorallia populi]|uniref:TetR/AcrR family transcriptional regulator n=1 Tax=Actinocorallia populi TaxID=2079200 RepID=UPI000D08D22A|nr:TetR family transcriptional regulator [Actinocorallia populi]